MTRKNQGAKSKNADSKNKVVDKKVQNSQNKNAKNPAKGKHPGINPETLKQRAEVAAMMKSPILTLRQVQITSVNGKLECNPYVDLDSPQTPIVCTEEMRKLPLNQLIPYNKTMCPLSENSNAINLKFYEYSGVNVAMDNLQAFAGTTNPQRDAMILTNIGLGLRGVDSGNLGRLHRDVCRNSAAYKGRDYTKLAAEFCKLLMGVKVGDRAIEGSNQVLDEQNQGCGEIVPDQNFNNVTAKSTKECSLRSKSNAVDIVQMTTVQAYSELTWAMLSQHTVVIPGRRDLLAHWLLDFTYRHEYSLKTFYVAINVADIALQISGSIQPKKLKLLALAAVVKGMVFKRSEIRGISSKVEIVEELRTAQRNLKLVVGEYCFRPLKITRIYLGIDSKPNYLDIAKYFIEMCLLSEEMPAIAVGSVRLAFELFGDELFWIPPLQELTAFQVRNLRAIAKKMVALVLAGPTELLSDFIKV